MEVLKENEEEFRQEIGLQGMSEDMMEQLTLQSEEGDEAGDDDDDPSPGETMF